MTVPKGSQWAVCITLIDSGVRIMKVKQTPKMRKIEFYQPIDIRHPDGLKLVDARIQFTVRQSMGRGK